MKFGSGIALCAVFVMLSGLTLCQPPTPRIARVGVPPFPTVNHAEAKAILSLSSRTERVIQVRDPDGPPARYVSRQRQNQLVYSGAPTAQMVEEKLFARRIAAEAEDPTPHRVTQCPSTLSRQSSRPSPSRCWSGSFGGRDSPPSRLLKKFAGVVLAPLGHDRSLFQLNSRSTRPLCAAFL